MPPWAARQWHVWRRVSSNLCCPQHSRPRLPHLRFYYQHPSPHNSTSRLKKANSAVIVPSSPANTCPEDLIAHIEPVSTNRLPQDRFAIFFVTPSFATWLLDDNLFLHKALRQAYTHMKAHAEYRIHALCAVVDKLPVSTPITNTRSTLRQSLERTISPPVTEKGQEGLAYATLRVGDSIPTSFSSTQDGVKAAIDFVGTERLGEEEGYFVDSVRLPLANTVFQTGTPATMIYSTWAKAAGSTKLTLEEKRDVSHHSIRMHLNTKDHSTALSVPLVPLSRPRRVKASMGNILRRVRGPNGKEVSASKELEEIVPSYFKARGEPSQTTTVWALVMDPDSMRKIQKERFFLLGGLPGSLDQTSEEKLWERLWKKDPPRWNFMIPTALSSGARLHRVLSGGGGWGKKAGLLALDPVPTTPSRAEEEPSQFDDPRHLSDALQQVTRDGDHVQFFISPSVAPDDKGVAKNPHDHVWGLELGTIPSTSDALPIIPSQTEATKNEVTVYRNTFGALAEGGMVLSRNFKHKEEESLSLVGLTTVDVPFSRYSAVNWATTHTNDVALDLDALKNYPDPNPSRAQRGFRNILYSDTELTPGFLGLRSHKIHTKWRALGWNIPSEAVGSDLTNLHPQIRSAIDCTRRKNHVTYYETSLRRITLKMRRLVHAYKKIVHTRSSFRRKNRVTYYSIAHRHVARKIKLLIQEYREIVPLRSVVVYASPKNRVAYYNNAHHLVAREIRLLVQEYREIVPLRSVIVYASPKNQVAYCSERRRSISREMGPLIQEYREIMHELSTRSLQDLTYRQLQQQRSNQQPKPKPKLNPLPSLDTLPTETQRPTFRFVSPSIENILATCRRNGLLIRKIMSSQLSTKPRSYQDILSAARILDRETTRLVIHMDLILDLSFVSERARTISSYVRSLTKIHTDIWTSIKLRTRLPSLVNNSALDVYYSHIRLRRILIKITKREMREHPNSWKPTVEKLRINHLQPLRRFRDNLFVGENAKLTAWYIKTRLDELEHGFTSDISEEKGVKKMAKLVNEWLTD